MAEVLAPRILAYADVGLKATLAVQLCKLSTPEVIVNGSKKILEGIEVPYGAISLTFEEAGISPLGPEALEFKDTNDPDTIVDNLLGGVYGSFARNQIPPRAKVEALARIYAELTSSWSLRMLIDKF
jgi:hypothetical protein